jgi:peptidoglycan/LPS O-acetylase OafA/YrhL
MLYKYICLQIMGRKQGWSLNNEIVGYMVYIFIIIIMAAY